jgi:uncharacterized membrane protein YtjA (UPF0391 family)
MIRATIAFFILGIFAYLFGAYGIAGLSFEIGKILLFTFVIIALITLLASIFTGKKL